MRNAHKATDKWRHDAGYAFTLKTPYNDKTSPQGQHRFVVIRSL